MDKNQREGHQGSILVAVCHKPPKQDEEEDEVFQGCLAAVS